MGAEDNIKTVQTLYEAFGRGDVQAITDNVTDDVDWGAEASSTVAPWYGSHTGKKGVGDFFQAFGSTIEVEEFTPVAFAANENDVFAIVRYRGSARVTGKKAAMDLHHWFRFRDGKVYYYRGTEDTAQTEASLS
jgi:ketosteroid isomerase-like protein